MIPPAGADLVLIGLRGSGKTTLGRALAARCGVPFCDMDDLLAQRCGHPSAGAALQAMGEPAFRAAEQIVLRDLLDPARSEPARPAILALGGGAAEPEPARHLLRSAAREKRIRVVLLDASPEVLLDRINRESVPRPPLTSLPPLEEIRSLATRRLPAYRELAASVLDTSSMDAASAVAALHLLWLEDAAGAEFRAPL